MAKSDDGDRDRSVFADKDEALAVLRETAKSESNGDVAAPGTAPRKNRPARTKSTAAPRRDHLGIVKYGAAMLAGLGLGYVAFSSSKPECAQRDLDEMQARLSKASDDSRACASDLSRCKKDLDDCDDNEGPGSRVAPASPQRTPQAPVRPPASHWLR